MDVNQVIVNELAVIIGDNAKEIMDKAFFTDDLTPIKSSLLETGMKIENIDQILEEWNYDTIQCKSTEVTNFAKIQYELALVASEDKKEDLLRNAALKEVHLDSEQKYAGLGVYGEETIKVLDTMQTEKSYTM